MNKTKWLLTLSVPVALGSTLLVSCASQQNEAVDDPTMQTASNVPEGSTAKESAEKTGMTKPVPWTWPRIQLTSLSAANQRQFQSASRSLGRSK